MNSCQYTELASARIQDKRNVVISECVAKEKLKGFTLAQQIEVEEKGFKTNVFLKNAIHVDDIEGLYNLRDAINHAITKHEERSKK